MKHLLTLPMAALALCAAAPAVFAQPASAATPPAATAPAPAPVPGAVDLHADAILNHLSAVTRWYHDLQDGQSWVLQPADQFYWNSASSEGNEVVRQSFAAAQAEAGLIAAEPGKDQVGKPKGPIANSGQIQQAIADTQSRVDDLKDQISAINKQLSGRMPQAQRDGLAGQKTALEDALEINETFVDYLGRARSLLSGANTDNEQTAIMGQIQAIRSSVRGVFNDPGKPAAASQPSETDPQGTFAQAELVVRIIKDEHEIDKLADDDGSIAKLVGQADAIRTPLLASLRQMYEESKDASDAVAQAKGEDLVAEQRKLSSLAGNLRDVTDAMLALRAEALALDQSRTNLNDWKSVIVRHRDTVLRSLLERVVVIAILIAVLAVTSELWRRATFRYVHDLRRRRQLLLVRRFAYGSLIAMVLVMGLVSNLGSLATFAGFITAGIAVASQTIIVSMAAFFFMMGRNGVHVGDRVTVTSTTGSTVTGKVVEIDLVRFSVMELTGSGLDLRPTGRIASYANSLLFQTVPFFKHITGTDYGWHEIAVPLKPEADFDRVQKIVLDAVNEVYSEYRKILENQRGLIERTNEITLDVPEPTSQVLYGASGPELVTGYPIDRTGRISMDLRVARGVREALARNKDVAEMTSGEPELRGAAKTN